MSDHSHAYERAIAAIDAANAEDPNVVHVRGEDQPLALVHGRLASMWIPHLLGAYDDALLLAARAHHLRRWEVPRSSYPEGRPGYLRWRRDQKARHADDVAALLRDAGYDDATIGRTQRLIRREGLGSDPDAQAVEDAACLVFIETQLSAMIPRFEREHYLEVIRKSARKMSPRGIELVAEVPLDDDAKRLLADALGG